MDPLSNEVAVTVWATESLLVKTTVLPCLTVKLTGTNLKLEIDIVWLSGDGDAVEDGGIKSVGDPRGKPDELVGIVEGSPRFPPLSVKLEPVELLEDPYIDFTPRYINPTATMTPKTIKVFFI
jgi:hypothetical protein